MPLCDLCDCEVEVVLVISTHGEWPADLACEWCVSDVLGDNDDEDTPTPTEHDCCNSFCNRCV